MSNRIWTIDEHVTLAVVDYEHTTPRPEELDYNKLLKTHSQIEAINMCSENAAMIRAWEKFIDEEVKILRDIGDFTAFCVNVGHLTCFNVVPDFPTSDYTSTMLTEEMSNKKRKAFRKEVKLVAQFAFDNSCSRFAQNTWFVPVGAHALVLGFKNGKDLIQFRSRGQLDNGILAKISKKFHAYLQIILNNVNGGTERRRTIYAADGRQILEESDKVTVKDNGEREHSNPDFGKKTLADVVIDDIDRYRIDKEINLF